MRSRHCDRGYGNADYGGGSSAVTADSRSSATVWGLLRRPFLWDNCPRSHADCDAVGAACSYTVLAAFLNHRAERMIYLNGSARLPANGGIRIVDRCIVDVKLWFKFWTLKCCGCPSGSEHRFELAEGSFPV